MAAVTAGGYRGVKQVSEPQAAEVGLPNPCSIIEPNVRSSAMSYI